MYTNSWSVVTTAKASPVLMAAFVAHYKYLGADNVFLFVDDPEKFPYELSILDGFVILIQCDSEYWNGRKPDDHRGRQVKNSNRALKDCASCWLLHVDIDEFIDAHPHQIKQSLTTNANVLRLYPIENLFYNNPEKIKDVFESDFHGQLPKFKAGKLSRQSVSQWWLSNSKGLQGHIVGKIFVRVDKVKHLNIHKCAPKFDEEVLPFNLCHFFSMGYNDWFSKHLRRLNPERLKPIPRWKRRHLDLLLDAITTSPEAIEDLYKEAMIYDKEKTLRLSKVAMIYPNNLNIIDKVVEVFGSEVAAMFDLDINIVCQPESLHKFYENIAIKVISEEI